MRRLFCVHWVHKSGIMLRHIHFTICIYSVSVLRWPHQTAREYVCIYVCMLAWRASIGCAVFFFFFCFFFFVFFVFFVVVVVVVVY